MPHTLSLTEAAQKIQTGDLAPLDLLSACLDRIDALEEQLCAWKTLNREEAIATASLLQEELAQNKCRGPLHGIPIGIKDIMFTKDLRTTAGSAFFENFVPDYDATVVHRLRSAGAVILGKTATTEFACFDPASTRNPWNLNHTPGGSSSGSASAVAARMVPAALGSQTGGSITRPAAYCGLVGLKPTYARVSVHGVFPVAFSLDTVGPIARSVSDAAHLLQVLAGPDPNDPLCSTAPTSDYLPNQPLNQPPRIGLVRTYFLEEADETMHETVDLATEAFRSAGAEVIDIVLPKRFKHIHNKHRLIMYAETAAYHADRFENQPKKFQPGIRELVQEGLFLPAAAYADARQHQIILRHEIRQVFKKNVDVLLTPATPTPAPEGLESTGDPAFNSPWTYTGLPTISLPVTLTSENLPTAIQLIGPAFEESHLLQAAAWCESQLCFDAVPRL